MNSGINSLILRLANIAVFIFMLTVNYLANALPLNGYKTGELSDMYPNLFVPSGVTFSIWILIYFLIFLFVIYQSGFLLSDYDDCMLVNKKIGVLFIISSFANIAWILAWHYLQILSSLVLMIIMLLSLLTIYIKIADDIFKTRRAILFVRIPFSIYTGWITVALLANLSAAFSRYGVLDNDIISVFWTILAIILTLLCGIFFMQKFKDCSYSLVLIWAILGILYKHYTVFQQGYIIIIVVAIFAVTVLLVMVLKTYLTVRRPARSRRSV